MNQNTKEKNVSDILKAGENRKYGFSELYSIMKLLRSENGCPWDKEQTHKSIRNNFLEEAYEAVEGIDKNDDGILCEELGDVLLQVVFHAVISEDGGGFSMDDVCDGICRKLILRHPHIFADGTADDPEQVLKKWDEIKKEEKKQKTATDTLRGVSCALPSLARACKLQAKAAKTGFTYKTPQDAMGKADEEYSELREALTGCDKDKIEEELGDALFALSNVARLSDINAEEALFRANEKFISRFDKTEKAAKRDGFELCELDVNKMSSYWENAKKS